MSENYNEQEATIRAWLSYYIDGRMTGAWQNFPTTSDEMEYNLGRSGVEAEHLTGVLDTVYETTVPKLELRLPRQPDLDELNYLAVRIEVMSENEREVFGAVMDTGRHCGSMAEIINTAGNLDCFDLYPIGFRDDKEFGETIAEMHHDEFQDTLDRLHASDDPGDHAFAFYVERMQESLDLTKYSRNTRAEECGLLTGNGYLLLPEKPLPQIYSGPQDIPAEHRLTTPPMVADRKPSLLGQLADLKAGGRAADASRPDAPEKKPPSGPEL